MGNEFVIDIAIANIGCNGHSIVICEKETGVFYSSQCGCMRCFHPIFEGFIISCYPFYDYIDDCPCNYPTLQEYKYYIKQLADQIDIILKQHHGIISLDFDYERIDQLTEGWWPVIVDIKDDIYSIYYRGKGIVCGWNCD